MKAVRFVIEGEWSGYRSSQQRVVHRTVHSGAYKKLRAWIEQNRCIRYTDGTCLYLSVRDCKPRERVVDLRNSYGALIDKCVRHNVTSVADLPK